MSDDGCGMDKETISIYPLTSKNSPPILSRIESNTFQIINKYW